MFESLRELAHTHHVGILVHFHTNNTSVKHSSSTLTARSDANAYADGFLHLKQSHANKDVVLSGTGRAYAERIDLSLSFHNGYWEMAEQSEVRPRATLTQARRAIIDVLHEHDRPMKPGEIALAPGKHAGTIRTMLYEMKASNLIQATDLGYIALVPREKRLPQTKSSSNMEKERINSDRRDNNMPNITQFQRPRPRVNRGIRASTNRVEHAGSMPVPSVINTLPLILK
ncbi:MAG TPA: hypothetical protein VNG51_29030 [Ktedonobacteraceae bacterium]|nr:hypothetical protein [Ktedonobacteraceae bacterium]